MTDNLEPFFPVCLTKYMSFSNFWYNILSIEKCGFPLPLLHPQAAHSGWVLEVTAGYGAGRQWYHFAKRSKCVKNRFQWQDSECCLVREMALSIIIIRSLLLLLLLWVWYMHTSMHPHIAVCVCRGQSRTSGICIIALSQDLSRTGRKLAFWGVGGVGGEVRGLWVWGYPGLDGEWDPVSATKTTNPKKIPSGPADTGLWPS